MKVIAAALTCLAILYLADAVLFNGTYFRAAGAMATDMFDRN